MTNNNNTAKANQNNKELKKHVSTIHCANSLSLLQRKIANALLFHAYDNLLLQDEYQISVKQLCNLIGYASHDYKTIKKALIDLLSTVIEWNIIEEGLPENEGEWNASSIIADASIKDSICKYSYSKRMKQLLYMPAMYGRLNMRIQSQFKSSYGLALYENVVRYQNLTQTPWFELNVFRRLMGIAADKYLIFRDFKRRVVEKALDEVNSIANLTVTVEFKRKDRQVSALRFLISKSKQSTQINTTFSVLRDKLKKVYGLSEKQIQTVINNHEENYILEKITLIENSKTYHTGKIINLGKYLIHALTDDYQFPKSVEQNNQKQTQQMDEQQSLMNFERVEMLKTRSYQNYIDNYLQQRLGQLSPEERNGILEEFSTHIKSLEIVNKLYQKQGLKNKIIFIEFKNYVKHHYPELLQNVLTKAEFEQTDFGKSL